MATLYDEPFWTPVGARPQLLVNQSVTVYQDEDGVQSASLLDLFTDETGATPSANPFTSDSAGNVRFWSDAAFAWVKVGNHAAVRVQIQALGGYTPGGTDVAVADGGTGASSASAARTNLGLGNVDDISAMDMPVSTAQGAALDEKANTADVTTALAGKEPSGAYRPAGTDVAVADGGTGASTQAGAWTNLGLAFITGRLFHVKSPVYGAVGDGVADDTAAIQAAIDAADAVSLASNVNPVVYFSHGIYNYSALDWKKCQLAGDGAWVSQLVYTGAAAGTGVARTTSNNLYCQGLAFKSTSGQVATHIDCTADPSTDYGDYFEDVYFSTCTGSALKTGLLTNLHMHRIRWEGCEYAIEVMGGGGPLRVLDVDQFTIDFSPATNHKGFIKYVAAGATVTMFARIANGRYEGSSTVLAPAALVHVVSNPANSLNPQPVKLQIENFAGQISGTQTQTIAIVHQETTQTNVISQILTENSHFDGWGAWFSGTLRSGYTAPTWPGSGRVALGLAGAAPAGTSPAVFGQLQNARLVEAIFEGRQLVEELGSSPIAPGAGFLYLYARSGGTLRYKTSGGTEHILAAANQAQTFTGKQTFSSEIEVDGALNHDGTTAGFFGATPVTQPAANADTSGATLAELETEVNQLKAALRSLGLMAP